MNTTEHEDYMDRLNAISADNLTLGNDLDRTLTAAVKNSDLDEIVETVAYVEVPQVCFPPATRQMIAAETGRPRQRSITADESRKKEHQKNLPSKYRRVNR